MDPQTISAIRILMLVGGTWLTNHGYGDAKDLTALSDPAVIEAAGGLLITIATAAWGLWERRPHGIIKAAAALPQVDAVLTKPKTADEIPVANVVSSLYDASKLPGVAARVNS